MNSIGQNVWFDLMSTDPEGAKAFYSEAIGWKNEAWPNSSPDMPYSIWMAKETGVGGLMRLPEIAEQMGAPSHWIAYTKVASADETVAQAQALGAGVFQAPFDLPEVGRVAVLADPQGAVFAVFQPKGEASGTKGEEVGEFGWCELNTRDYEAAWTFYSTLFGWKHTSSMETPMGPYFMFEDPEGMTRGGMSNAANQMNMPAHWLHYVRVDDIDAAMARIIKLGGKVPDGAMDVPGGDKVAQCVDPQGAVFAIFAGPGK